MKLTKYELGAPLPSKSRLGRGCKVTKIKSTFLEGEKPGPKKTTQAKDGQEVIKKAERVLGSKRAIAKACGLSPQTLYHWLRRGSFPADQIEKIRKVMEGAQ